MHGVFYRFSGQNNPNYSLRNNNILKHYMLTDVGKKIILKSVYTSLRSPKIQTHFRLNMNIHESYWKTHKCFNTYFIVFTQWKNRLNTTFTKRQPPQAPNHLAETQDNAWMITSKDTFFIRVSRLESTLTFDAYYYIARIFYISFCYFIFKNSFWVPKTNI